MNYEGINQSIGEEQIESLRLILGNIQGEAISYDDAEEVATTLISLYDLLAREPEHDLEIEANYETRN